MKLSNILRAAFALLAISLSAATAAPNEDRPNIVIIFADDLDADEIGCTADEIHTWATPSGAKRVVGKGLKAGSSQVYTPAIDSLAENGMMFTRFYVNATVCSSSRYCLLTGRLATAGPEIQLDYEPGTHARLEWRPGMFRAETNLPKTLQGLGYRTAIIGKWHNIPQNVKLPKRVKADHQANATYEHTSSVDEKLKRHYAAHKKFLSDGFGWDVVDRMEWGNSIVNLDWQCEGALKFIEETDDQPFFLYCALPVPHGQYSFGYNDISTYDDRVSSNGILDYVPDVLPSVEDVYRRVEEQGAPRENAMATRMDDYVDAVLKKLDEKGIRENTIVIFTSDHGSRGKNSVNQGGAKVPMIVSWPAKVEAGSECDSLIGSIDISATLVDLAGGELPGDMSQHNDSFGPQLLGDPEPTDWRESLLIEAGNSKGVVTRQWSYIANRVPPETAKAMKERPGEVYWTGLDHHNYQNDKMYPNFWDADQLYDLEKDIYEMENLAGNPEYAGVLKMMKGELSEVLKELPFAFGEFTR
ncbi:MAG: sulfatase-like hydrolase/transferase, partial [Verrucomicrobiota bacterium]